MTDSKIGLDRLFDEAVERASKTDLKFPPDIRLYFYAYYKRAMGNHTAKHYIDDMDNALINAFKMNAIFQVKNLTIEEAKQAYIDLVDQQIPK